MQRKLLGILVLAAAVMGAGCDNEVEDATQPSPPAPTTTETFTGTLTVNGGQTHTFVVVASGTVTATIKELVTPETGVTVGLFLGTWNGTSCASVIANDSALQGNAVIGTATGSGTLCVRIHDVGKLTQSQNYTLEVVHP